MKFQEISNKLAEFVKRYHYVTGDCTCNMLFFIKCLVLKFLADNSRIDFHKHQKELKKSFTLNHILELWKGAPLENSFWGNTQEAAEGILPMGDEIWEWICQLMTSTQSLQGENPGLIASLYEESLHIHHKKNHGIFYTPEAIAELMAKKVLNKVEAGEELQNIRVLDPACGSGSLLNAIYDRILIKCGDFDREERELLHKKLLEGGLMGVDRDPLACLVTRLLLTLKGETLVEPLGIQCGDILTEELISLNSVDVIIGNPPYVGHKEIDNHYMKNLKFRYGQVYQDKGDLSYCFIFRGWELLKPQGQLIHITSRYFIEAFFARQLRHFIKKAFTIKELVDFNGLRIIEGVGVDPAIILLEKNEAIGGDHRILIKRFLVKNHKPDTYPQLIELLMAGEKLEDRNKNDFFEAFEISQRELQDESWRLYSPITRAIIDKIEARSPFTLDHVIGSFQGVITGNDKAFIFAVDDDRLEGFSEEHKKKWIKNKDVQAFRIEKPQKILLYTNGIEAIQKFPQVEAYLKTHQEKLQKRRECQNGKLPWYKLQWGRNPEHFQRRKIVFPYKATKNRFAIDDNHCYFSADVYGFTLAPRLYHQLTEEALVILLNSRLYNYYFKSFGKKLGDKLYEYYPNTLLRLGIPDLNDENLKYFKESYDRIEQLVKNGDSTQLSRILEKMDRWLYDYFELSQNEIREIEMKS